MFLMYCCVVKNNICTNEKEKNYSMLVESRKLVALHFSFSFQVTALGSHTTDILS